MGNCCINMMINLNSKENRNSNKNNMIHSEIINESILIEIKPIYSFERKLPI